LTASQPLAYSSTVCSDGSHRSPLPTLLAIAMFSFAVRARPLRRLSKSPTPNPSPKSTLAGPCTADFTITRCRSAGLRGQHPRPHRYGFASLHKFDLTVGTNADGKARFIGLPRLRNKALLPRLRRRREGSAFDDPAKTCKTQFTVVLRKNS